jgi:adenosylmethionine-8-amino-7-oxononanoate aminotransferase
VESVVRAARAQGVTVIFDEVAVGIGRLGSLFAFEQLSDPALRPDMVCLAKGLTAGVVPLSAVLTTGRLFERFLGTAAERKTFYHGHTFTGSALGCAAALAALDAFTAPGFLPHLNAQIIPALTRMLEGLKELPYTGDVRGRGMMWGLELVRDTATREPFPAALRTGHRAVLAARARGVNLRAIGDLLLCVPPLTITPGEIELLGRVYRESIAEAAGQVAPLLTAASAQRESAAP